MPFYKRSNAWFASFASLYELRRWSSAPRCLPAHDGPRVHRWNGPGRSVGRSAISAVIGALPARHSVIIAGERFASDSTAITRFLQVHKTRTRSFLALKAIFMAMRPIHTQDGSTIFLCSIVW